METIVDKLYQLNYDTISSEKTATVSTMVYIPFLCDFTMMYVNAVPDIVSFTVQLQLTSLDGDQKSQTEAGQRTTDISKFLLFGAEDRYVDSCAILEAKKSQNTLNN